MGSQAWTELALVTVSATERVSYLRAPGLSGADQIHVNIRQYQDAALDYYNFQIHGAVGYSAVQPVTLQPGASPAAAISLWNSAIPYWLVADGRHFKLVTRISTTYQTAFAGFILPYATSTEMPYPMFIGGSTSLATSRWSVANFTAGAFFDPPEASAYMRNFDGSWIQISNYTNQAGNLRGDNTESLVFPWQFSMRLGSNEDGSYGLLPAVLHSSLNSGNVFGEIPGVFYISGFNLASEDTITQGPDTYLVVQSGYRTSMRDYAAIKLG